MRVHTQLRFVQKYMKLSFNRNKAAADMMKASGVCIVSQMSEGQMPRSSEMFAEFVYPFFSFVMA